MVPRTRCPRCVLVVLVKNEAADRVTRIATRLHKVGALTGHESGYSGAEPWYRLALRLEHRPAVARQTQFYLGELLWVLRRHDEATEAYASVGASGDSLSLHASHSRAVALQRAEEDAAGKSDAAPERLAGLRGRLVNACDVFVETYPADPAAASLALSAARTAHQLGKKQEARARAEAVLRRWPDSEHATEAKELIRSLE